MSATPAFGFLGDRLRTYAHGQALRGLSVAPVNFPGRTGVVADIPFRPILHRKGELQSSHVNRIGTEGRPE